MNATTDLEWVKRGDNFASTASGRFDLMYTHATRRWVAINSDTGRVFRDPCRIACVAWIIARIEGAQ